MWYLTHFIVNVSTWTSAVLYNFYFTRVHLDTCRTVQSFMVHVSIWHVWNLNCALWYRFWSNTCSCWHVSHYAKFFVHLFKITLYNSLYTCPRWHCRNVFTGIVVDSYRTVQNVNVHVSRWTRFVLYQLLLHTCPCWHVEYCTHFCCTLVCVDTYCTLRSFFGHVLVWPHALIFYGAPVPDLFVLLYTVVFSTHVPGCSVQYTY